ncbi:MAG TPA: MucB/RseB C-terminal domain-containing protein [Steroidobacteraceae bacterium]|nr:MucB/RseB C-terminal domain-containing protein [Steroidobacteraceae bacterium]
MIGAAQRSSARILRRAVFCGLLATAPVLSATASDPRAWLEKMSRALATRDYDGTFFHLSDGRVEAMRIVHRYRHGRVTERLQSLEGSGREYIRSGNGRLTCYLPDEHTVLVETQPTHSPFLSTLPRFGPRVDRFYRISALPDERLLGKPVKVIVVSPKDQFRFGYRLWLDRKTAMPLKTQLCDSRGRVLEQILFATLEMPKTIADRELRPNVPTAGMRWIVQGPTARASAGAADLRPARLPPGFRLTAAGVQTIGSAQRPAEHLVYSDGLATVSLFVERKRGVGAAMRAAHAPLRGLARIDAGFAFSTVVEGHPVTAVGEVPAQTVEFIAHAVRPFTGGAMTPAPARR